MWQRIKSWCKGIDGGEQPLPICSLRQLLHDPIGGQIWDEALIWRLSKIKNQIAPKSMEDYCLYQLYRSEHSPEVIPLSLSYLNIPRSHCLCWWDTEMPEQNFRMSCRTNKFATHRFSLANVDDGYSPDKISYQACKTTQSLFHCFLSHSCQAICKLFEDF